jgi:hypothetical protein
VGTIRSFFRYVVWVDIFNIALWKFIASPRGDSRLLRQARNDRWEAGQKCY